MKKKPYTDNSDAAMQEFEELSALKKHLKENIIAGMTNFRIVIQPVVTAAGGQPVAGETLLRWRFKEREISPEIFIPLIEQEYVFCEIGRWVFERGVCACSYILRYFPDFYLTINMSLQQIYDENFIEFIRQVLLKYDMDGEHIILEMTESCMDKQPEKLERFVQVCGKLGIGIALDDFGSGYSSLRVLLHYPCSIIKFDRSLLLEIGDSAEKRAFIASLIFACHQLGKRVCVEGVETELQNRTAKEARCDLIQGFYYYKPMEVEQIHELFAKYYGESEG